MNSSFSLFVIVASVFTASSSFAGLHCSNMNSSRVYTVKFLDDGKSAVVLRNDWVTSTEVARLTCSENTPQGEVQPEQKFIRVCSGTGDFGSVYEATVRRGGLSGITYLYLNLDHRQIAAMFCEDQSE